MAKMVTISLDGTTPSAPFPLLDSTILRVYMPPLWTDSAIGLLESETELGTYNPVYDDEGVQITLAAGANRVLRIDERIMQHARWGKLYALHAQVAARALKVQVVLLRELIGLGAV